MADSTERRGAHAHGTTLQATGGAKAGVAPFLRRLTATELALYLKVKAAHWTVFGPLFREIHHLLDDVAETSIEAVDEAAERAAQLGALPPLTLADVGALSIVRDRSAEKLSNRQALEDIAADLGAVIDLYREAVAAADHGHDAASVDLLSKIAVKHEKMAWFVRQTLATLEAGGREL